MHSKLPVLVYRLDSPVKLLTKSLGKELFNGNIELLAKHDSQTRVDVVLYDISNHS
jgi:hypothetical protein